jgi:myo-inositol-1(or 4)-monophosphatase
MNTGSSHLLETAIRAARTGGQLALARLGKPGYRKWKAPGSLLVEAVLEIQEGIIDVIGYEFPDHHILAEESDTPQPTDKDPLWVIDPLDGSLNFYHGLPTFAISIGYREGGVYRLGVVYDPNRDELFRAEINQKAYLNDRRIRVHQFADGQDAFHNAMVATDWQGSPPEIRQAIQVFRFLGGEVLNVQTFGSPVLGLCYVAAGRLHAYYGLSNMGLWDVAAASVILREADATLTDLDGGTWQYSEGGYLATNSVIHGSMIGVVSSVRKLQRQTEALRQG